MQEINENEVKLSPRSLDNLFWFAASMGEAAAHIEVGFFNLSLRDKEHVKAKIALSQAELIAEVGLKSPVLASHPKYFIEILQKGWWGEANQQIKNFIDLTKISEEV
jgi:hypothetical protein